jgi:hypothetical protein
MISGHFMNVLSRNHHGAGIEYGSAASLILPCIMATCALGHELLWATFQGPYPAISDARCCATTGESATTHRSKMDGDFGNCGSDRHKPTTERQGFVANRRHE